MNGYRPSKEMLESLAAPSPYVCRPMTVFIIEAPSSKRETELERMSRQSAERERQKELQAKANTLFMPMDNSEYQYYHKPTGRFVTLGWHAFDYNEIVLDKDEMEIARKAFKERWPDERYGTAYYDLEQNKFQR